MREYIRDDIIKEKGLNPWGFSFISPWSRYKKFELQTYANNLSENFGTHFCVDNFDVLVDRKAGRGSIITTHIVAF